MGFLWDGARPSGELSPMLIEVRLNPNVRDTVTHRTTWDLSDESEKSLTP